MDHPLALVYVNIDSEKEEAYNNVILTFCNNIYINLDGLRFSLLSLDWIRRGSQVIVTSGDGSMLSINFHGREIKTCPGNWLI